MNGQYDYTVTDVVEACISISSKSVQLATSINRSVSLIRGSILYRDKLKFRAYSEVSFSKRSTLSLDFSIFNPSRLLKLFETHVRHLTRASLLFSRYSSADDRTDSLLSVRQVDAHSFLETRYSSKSL